MRSSYDTDNGITSINVAPLVDVTLVLLIIFMMTATATKVTSSIPFELPGRPSTGIQTILSVTLSADGTSRADGIVVPDDDAIVPIARDALAKSPHLSAVIDAAPTVSHGRVIHMLDVLRQAGISKVTFRAPTPGVRK